MNQSNSVDTGANCVTVSNVAALSNWTLGNPTTGPTAVAVRSMSAGRNWHLNLISLLLVLASGAAGGWHAAARRGLEHDQSTHSGCSQFATGPGASYATRPLKPEGIG